MLAAGLTLAIILLLSGLVGSTTFGGGVIQVNPATIQVFEASAVGLPRSILAADTTARLTQRRRLDGAKVTQYHLSSKNGTMPKSILVAGMGEEGSLYVNGVWVAGSQPHLSPGPVQGRYWLSATIPDRLLNASQNRLDIVMAPSGWRTGLAGVQTGTQVRIERAARALSALQVWLHTATWIIAFIGAFCVPLVLITGRSKLAALGGAVLAALLLATYILGEGQVDSDIVQTFVSWGDVVLVIAGCVALYSSRSIKGIAGGFFAGAALSLLIAGFASLLGWRIGLSFPVTASIAQLAPLLFCGIAMPLLVTIGRQLIADRADSARLAAQQAELVAQQAKQIERQAEWQAVIEERKRFTRDIHDGIGGQLVSLLWRVRYETVPADELASELESGIADLRLVADALDEGPVSLSVALWNFYARARQQLDVANIAFTWELPADFDIEWTDARRILSLYRMLQECVTNVVRHSQAKTLLIKFEQVQIENKPFVKVTVRDDGIGFDQAKRPGGRGLTNLKTRTEQMHGTLQISAPPTGTGTQIQLLTPATDISNVVA
jgi:signal transduction histidine kinase